MLTHRRNQKTLVQEANRASSKVASQARDVASGAGEMAKTARSELGGLRRLARDRAERKVTGARRATAARIQGTASRLSSAADVVESGRQRQKRRWPRVVALVGLVAAAAVVVGQRVRSMVQRDATGGEAGEGGDGHRGETGGADRAEGTGQVAEAGSGGGRRRASSGAAGEAGEAQAEGGTSGEPAGTGRRKVGSNAAARDDGVR
jgi:hypothetical protein